MPMLKKCHIGPKDGFELYAIYGAVPTTLISNKVLSKQGIQM